jgi:hypothetical protein
MFGILPLDTRITHGLLRQAGNMKQYNLEDCRRDTILISHYHTYT